MLTIDLNCDLGEGFKNDDLILPYISSVNIACGFHAGSFALMRRTIVAAVRHKLLIGAHPSYPDRENFGRKDMLGTELQYNDLPAVIIEQVGRLQQFCIELGTKLHHVKPHGALYNRAAKEGAVSALICSAIQQVDPKLKLYGLSGSIMKKEAANFNLSFASEVFADRTYQEDGSLTPRSEPFALIEDTAKAADQALYMVKEKKVITVTGKPIPIEADTICIHGDGSHAVEFAKAIHEAFQKNDIEIAAVN